MGLPPCRKIAVFYETFSGSDKQSRSFRTCVGVKNPIQRETETVSVPSPGKNEQTTVIIDQSGDSGHVEERGCSGGQLSERPVSEQLVLVGKKDGGNRPVINLKQLNAFVPYQSFKMEGLHLLKEMLQEKDYMCKIDLKDAYFCLLLHPMHTKFVRFQWEGQIYEFLFLCFGLGPAPRLFTKLLKVPIALIRRLNMRIIIYLEDMLLMSRSVEELLIAQDTLIFLLQLLGFVINQKKSLLSPVQEEEFLGMEINSIKMTLTLPQEKVNNLLQDVMKNPRISLWKLSSLIGSLCSTAQAVLPSQLQLRYSKHQLINSLRNARSYKYKFMLDSDSLQEIRWWL